jgi:MFS family permease
VTGKHAVGSPGGAPSPVAGIRALVACAAAHYTAGVGLRVAVALTAVHAGLAPASIGLLLATFALVPMILAVRGGQLVDRVGVRRPMLAGTTLAAVAALACAALPHPAVFAVAAGVAGLGGMAFHLGMQHAAGEMGGPARRTANFNLLTMSFSVSGLLGPPAVGLIIDHAGHRAAFAATGATMLAVLLALRRFPFDRYLPQQQGDAHAESAAAPAVDESARPAAGPDRASATDADTGADGESRADAPPAASAFSLLGTPRIRRLLIASLLASASWDTYQFVLPLHAGAIGLSASSVGFAIAAFSAGSLSVRLMLPALVGRMHPARWMQVSLAVCVLAFAAAPLAPSFAALIALSFLVGVGPGIAQPLLMAALHSASPPGRAGEAAGLRMTLLSATQLGLPVVLGLVAGALGTASLFWLYAATAAAIGLALARAERRRDATPPARSGFRTRR